MIADFFQNYKWDGRPWLIVGMGPTFSEHPNYDLSAYNILGLNKVVREIPVDLCQIIDFYILDKVKEHIFSDAKFLVMPYFPHYQCRPWMDYTLFNLAQTDPTLRDLTVQSKLLAFNLSTVPIRINDTPSIKAVYFSAEAAVSLLANLGVKEIRLLGVDGGTSRATVFSDHGPCDPRGFDIQWTTINANIANHNLNIQHLVRNPDGLHPH